MVKICENLIASEPNKLQNWLILKVEHDHALMNPAVIEKQTQPSFVN